MFSVTFFLTYIQSILVSLTFLLALSPSSKLLISRFNSFDVSTTTLLKSVLMFIFYTCYKIKNISPTTIQNDKTIIHYVRSKQRSRIVSTVDWATSKPSPVSDIPVAYLDNNSPINALFRFSLI